MEGINLVAQLMAISAVTAPKAAGKDFIQTKIIEKDDLQKLGRAMIDYGEKHEKKNFDRDGKNVLNSDVVLLVGLKGAATLGLDCGACGFETCAALNNQKMIDKEFKGPICVHRLLDLGIALGSAVKTASMLNVDNRIMYRIGAVARNMGLVDWDLIMGIPLSVSGKSIYFDR